MSVRALTDLRGRIAVVTGAAGLIGKAHCEALAEAGATVIACDLDGDAADAVAKHLEGDHVGMAIDITNAASIKQVSDETHDCFGRVDILVNNAAMNDMVEHPTLAAELSRFERYPVDMWRRVIDVNVTGMFLCCQIIGSTMAERGKGSIINVASTYGIVAPDQSLYKAPDGTQRFYKSAAYPVSKAAVIMLTKYLATYWGDRSVRVNTLSPGGVENGQDPHFIQQYVRKTPLGRMANSTDYQGALLYLASDASAYMTGHNLVVDGGWTAW
ncbi:MAG: SDR family oxidoreductase [Candidatus Kapabacteria bacterium]|nr:SDR family oxidoreductase [Candidatus Kapabacteria bacterium]